MLTDLQQLGSDTAKLAAAPLWSLPDAELVDCLHTAYRIEQAVAALQTLLVHQIDIRGLPAGQNHRTTSSWLRTHLRLDRRQAAELADRAALLSRWPDLYQSVLDGHLDIRQATTIAATLTAIPDHLSTLTPAQATCDADGRDGDCPPVTGESDRGAFGQDSGRSPGGSAETASGQGASGQGASGQGASGEDGFGQGGSGRDASGQDGFGCGDSGPGGSGRDGSGPDGSGWNAAGIGPSEAAGIVQEARTTLIAMAGRFSAGQLGHIGERILAHVAPHLADQADKIALDRQEKRAHARRGLTLSHPVDGLVRLTGTLGVEDAAIVTAALHPLCTPRSEEPRPEDRRSLAQQRSDALVEICRLGLRTGELPTDGGQPPQVTLTVAYDPLTRTLGPATTDTGHRLSPATARRLACDAKVLPLVLGGPSQILDAGRARRLATGPLRQALAARDRGCAHPDCDLPPRWTDAHHLIPWTEGGPTTLDNLVLLCRRHHRVIHDPGSGWQIKLGPDHLPDFIPPPDIDPLQRPRRNLYHPRQ